MRWGILLIALFQFLTCVYSVTLYKKSLSNHPLAVCNDGTPAAYFTQDLHNLTSPKVVIYLAPGGGCFTKENCQQRCEVDSPDLCTEDPADSHDYETLMWCEEPSENPAFHAFFKVYVPYCSSDVFSGTADASEDTGNYTFHGKHIVEAVVKDIIENIEGVGDITQLVFIGASAGAFGVGSNCDFVADVFESENPEIDFRCIADGGDFFPASLNAGQCDHYEVAAVASAFWASKPDESCEEAVGLEKCLIFGSYFSHVSTNFMVVSNYVDTSM